MKTDKFRVGEKVVSLSTKNPLDPSSQLRVIGCTYVVCAVSFCEKCGDQTINIGLLPSPRLETTKVTCGRCGTTSSNRGLSWTHSTHFCRRDRLYPYLLMAIEEENYRMAALLKSIIEQQVLDRVLAETSVLVI